MASKSVFFKWQNIFFSAYTIQNGSPKTKIVVLNTGIFSCGLDLDIGVVFIRAGQFKFFSAGLPGSIEVIYVSIFYYTTWIFTCIPEGHHGLKVGIFQMAISA